jgi:hypothetical protein
VAEPAIDVEARLDALFQLPLDAFVSARDALAKELKASGIKDASARVKALKRPSVAAWAINQLRYSAPELWAEVLAAGDGLRAQPGGLRESIGARRELLARTRARAEGLLTGGGHAVSNQLLQRVSATLESFAFHGSAAPIPAGRLVEELEAPSFEEMAALALPASATTPAAGTASSAPLAPARFAAVPAAPAAPPPPAAAVDRAALEARRRVEAARERVEAAEGRLRAARRRVEESRLAVESAQEAARAARSAREELESRLAEARAEESRRIEVLSLAGAAQRAAEASAREDEMGLASATSELARLRELATVPTEPEGDQGV